MNDSIIKWHLFWGAVNKQDPAGLNQWLARWVFDDDAVRLSLKITTPTAQDLSRLRERDGIKCERCQQSLDHHEPVYRVYSDVIDLEVCAACAGEAVELGLVVELLDHGKSQAA